MNKSLWKPVNWIFFDLDDTLWNFTENSATSLRILYDISPILRKLFKSREEFIDIYHKNNSLMWDYYAKGLVDTNQLKLERWRRTLATRQFEVLTAVCEELDRNYLEILAKQQAIIPGVLEMLSRLSKKFLLAILSNGFSETQYQKLHYSGFEKYITRTIVSEEIGINKPNLKIFEYAVEETGADKPYLMVGDNAETDIIGAMNAGWYAIWVNPKGNPFPFSEEEIRKRNIDPSLLLATVSDMNTLEETINDFYSCKD